MSQARGSEAEFRLYDETEYGVVDAATGVVMHLTGFSVKGTRNKHDSAILRKNRQPAKAVRGNLSVAGGAPTELGPEWTGRLFKHALGQVASHRPVSNQPADVTGVTVLHAEKSCPTGAGTLAYAAAADTLTWAAAGDSAGAAVDVSAGGTFTLESDTEGAALTVEVDAQALPAQNESDAITVHEAYKHVFTVGDLPPGFTLEKDHGATISGSGRYVRYAGCRVASLALTFPQEGIPTAQLDVIGMNKEPAAAALSANPADHGHASFSMFEAAIEEAGAVLGIVTELNLTLANNLDEDGYVIAPGGKRRQLPEGMVAVTGSYTAMFEDTVLYNKMLAGAESTLRLTLTRGTGHGDAGNERIDFAIGPLTYEEDDTEVSGPGGMFINPNFTTFGESLTVTLYNAVENP